MRRLILILLISGLIFAIGASAFIYLNRDRIVPLFTETLSESINGQLDIKDAELTFWKTFPSVAVELHNVLLNRNDTLAYASRLSFELELIPLISSNRIEIKALTLSEGQLQIDRSANGKWNWDNLLINQQPKESSGKSLSIHEITLLLESVDLYIKDDYSKTEASIFIEEGRAGIKSDAFDLKLKIHSNGIVSGDRKLVANEKLQINSRITLIEDEAKLGGIQITKESLSLDGSGTYNLETNHADVNFEIEDQSWYIFSLLDLNNINRYLKKYKASGSSHYTGELSGNINNLNKITLKSDFEIKNLQLEADEYNQILDRLNVSGEISFPNLNSLKEASIKLKNLTGFLNDQEIQSSITFPDLSRSFADINVKTQQSTQKLISFLQEKERSSLKEIDGVLSIDVKYKGPLSQDFYKTKGFELSGDIGLQDLNIELNDSITGTEISGDVLLNNDQLALNNVTGKVNGKSFSLTGTHKGFIDYIIDAESKLSLDLDVEIEQFDLDRILISKGNTSTQSFQIPDNWDVKMNTRVKELIYGKLLFSTIAGSLQIADETIEVSDFNFENSDGNFMINGYLSRQDQAFVSYTSFSADNIDLKKFFNSFSNFNQSFIKSENLEGKSRLNGGINLELDSELNPKWNTLKSIVDLRITDGQLNDFQPVMALDSYFKKEDLSHLKFGELQNEIIIDNGSITIPRMTVESNVRNIEIEGTHGFDTKIDYHIKVPLKNSSRENYDKDARFGEVEEVQTGTSNVYLHISGTSEEFRTRVDKNATLQKVKQDIKKEISELKKALRKKKGQKDKEIELSEEEFDF